MRLEFDSNITAIPVKPAFLSNEQIPESTDFQELLHKGILAAKNGDRVEARNFLTQAAELNLLSEDAWMWLASISDYPEELIAFLSNVLTVNPSNERAIKWLAETERMLARSTEPQDLGVADAGASENVEPRLSSNALDHTPPDTHISPGSICPFCDHENDVGSFKCRSCCAALSLSDIESLLSNTETDRDRIQETVTEMESEWNLNDLNGKELTALGIGHINLKNFDEGLRYLHELLRKEPNNVILAGQLNAIAIRLDEMQRQNEIDEAKPKGRTILVVDDSATVRKLLSSKLEKSGHNVVCAVDGVEGLAKIAEALPDMVFLDISMPRKDGYEVCKEIRANPVAKDLPVVMISGKDGFFDKVRGKMAGASGYVTKPFGPDALMKALETHLTAEETLSEH
jgi:twitching motility two-component system response regulator PilG